MAFEGEFEREGALLERVLAVSPVGITIVDPDGEIVRANEHAERVLGLDASDLLGRTYNAPEWRIVDEAGEPIPDEDLPFSRVMDTGEAVHDYEHGIELPDGERVWLSISGAPILDPAGEIELVVFAIEDVTDRRDRERRLEQRSEQLAVLNRLVRHDIRNDMNILVGWLDALRTEVPPDVRERFEQTIRAGNHVIELTHAVREVMELIEEEGQGLEPVPEDLRLRLTEQVERTRSLYPDATIELGEVPDVEVLANPMLPSVFANLLHNAVQHNDSDDPHVAVTVEEHAETVLIRVADDGPGIPACHRETVFELGESGLGSEGTGLGLYLVSTLVEAYGGDVWIENNDPPGTVFCVELRKAP